MCGQETNPSLGGKCTQAFNVLGTKVGGREGIDIAIQHHLIVRATGNAIPHPGGATASLEMVASLRCCDQNCKCLGRYRVSLFMPCGGSNSLWKSLSDSQRDAV